MKRAILNPFTPIPKSEKSHVRGWSMVWAQRLGADILTKDSNLDNYDEFYIDHGVNFSGSLNLFGGFNDEVAERVLKLIGNYEQGAKVYSLDHDMASCNYAEQVKKRIGANTTSDLVNSSFIERLDDMLSQTPKKQMSDLHLFNQILGDSHSVAYSDSKDAINRMNGELLYSAMQTGLTEWIRANSIISESNLITLCLGSIDIRFHALQKGRWSAKEFATKYAQQVIKAKGELGIEISVCAPVPIEYEDRRIPKTGQYKGVNFNGSREERLEYTLEFIDTLDNYLLDFNLIMPPKTWYEMDGEEYAKKVMELSSSVHIAPIHYRSINSWSK